MSRNVAFYQELLKVAREGNVGAESMLREFITKHAPEKMPREVVLDVSELILEHMRDTLRGQAEQN